jgi:hypothetical protein
MHSLKLATAIGEVPKAMDDPFKPLRGLCSSIAILCRRLALVKKRTASSRFLLMVGETPANAARNLHETHATNFAAAAKNMLWID